MNERRIFLKSAFFLGFTAFYNPQWPLFFNLLSAIRRLIYRIEKMKKVG